MITVIRGRAPDLDNPDSSRFHYLPSAFVPATCLLMDTLLVLSVERNMGRRWSGIVSSGGRVSGLFILVLTASCGQLHEESPSHVPHVLTIS